MEQAACGWCDWVCMPCILPSRLPACMHRWMNATEAGSHASLVTQMRTLLTDGAAFQV
jgi:hypothetical protein